MLDDAGEAAIERHQHATFACRYRQELLVGSTSELLVASEGDIVAGLSQRRPDRVGDVLI
jgi:hypothetical protein